jgi:uncharacterized repeat protein (TIGR01451 family)
MEKGFDPMRESCRLQGLEDRHPFFVRLGIFLLVLLIAVIMLALVAISTPVKSGVSSGYQEYFIPGGEGQLWDIFLDMDTYDSSQLPSDLDEDEGMHAVISVVAGGDSTTIYYDHWEDGYDFDPDDPSTADETVTLNQGEIQLFESSYIPITRTTTINECGASPAGSGSDPCYDGRDRIYTAGGAVTVNRASWTESASTLYALAWEVYPTKPWLTQNVIPVGEDLANDPPDYQDFEKTYVIVQATDDNTTVEIDEPGGAAPDQTDVIDRGEVAQRYEIAAGTTVSASAPVQVQFIVGTLEHGRYELRGYTAVPQDLWDDEYYIPVGSFANGNSDVYLYNPSATDVLTVTWEELTAGGTFTIPAGGTLSYEDGRGALLPEGSGAYLSGSHAFWGIGSVDTESSWADWGYSLIPASYLVDDYTIGWAPSTLETNARGSFLFVTASRDNTTVFVDYDADGTVDDEYDMDRLEILQIDDTGDYDMTGAHVWASSPIAIVWGEDRDTVEGGENYLDLGYTTLPFQDTWIDLVLTLDKTADPTVIPADGEKQTTFTLVVNSHDFAVNDVDVTDQLPADWSYVDDSTLITFPDGSQASGDAADPSVVGQTLTWDLDQDMDADEALTVTFEAETLTTPDAYYSVNRSQVTGTRGLQTLSANDNATVYFSEMSMRKTSSAGGGGVAAGDTLTYTILITNNGSTIQRDIVLSDTVPFGTSYVPGSSEITSVRTVRDEFNAQQFNNNDGTRDWSGDWQNSESGVGVIDDPDTGDAYVLRVGVWVVDGTASRAADLSGAASAELSFDYRRIDLENNDNYYIEVSNDGGDSWDVLDTLSDGDDAAYQSASYDITAYISDTTSIRFRSDLAGGWLDRDAVYFDNVQIKCPPTTGPGEAPPSFLTDGYNLASGETVTVTYQVTVDDPTPNGLSAVVNTAEVTSDDLPKAIKDEASDPINPTAVWLAAFRAEPREDAVLVSWETTMEIDNAGFNLYRAPASTGPYTRLNPTRIPPKNPGATLGAAYTWLDEDVEPGVVYYYKLEDLDFSGVSTFHGPVSSMLFADHGEHRVFLPLIRLGR